MIIINNLTKTLFLVLTTQNSLNGIYSKRARQGFPESVKTSGAFIFAANSNFLIPTSLQPDDANL